MKCVIARHEEGITLNAFEFILDEEESIKLFNNKKEALSFLKENGILDEEIEFLKFFDYEKLTKCVYEEV